MPRDQVHESLATLYAAPLHPELWNDFLQSLCSAGGVNKAAIIVRDLIQNDHRILAWAGGSVRESAGAYEGHYARYDEWALRSPKQDMSGRVVQGETLCPEYTLVRSTFYNEFLRPFDVIQAAFLVYTSPPGVFESLSIFRGPSERSFGSEQLEVLEALSPHLQTALYTRRKLLSLTTRITDLENALDRLPSALVLLDSSGKCVLVNQAAKAILDRRNGLFLDRYASGGISLCASSPSEMTNLRRMIAGSIATAEGNNQLGHGAMLISRLSGRPLQIVVAPFRQEASAAPRTAAAIVFITDPENRADLPADLLRMLFGFTASESRLALGLLDGNSLSEVADIHCVSRETVRSQIKSIFQKTDTKRQSELVRLLTGLSGKTP